MKYSLKFLFVVLSVSSLLCACLFYLGIGKLLLASAIGFCGLIGGRTVLNPEMFWTAPSGRFRLDWIAKAVGLIVFLLASYYLSTMPTISPNVHYETSAD